MLFSNEERLSRIKKTKIFLNIVNSGRLKPENIVSSLISQNNNNKTIQLKYNLCHKLKSK